MAAEPDFWSAVGIKLPDLVSGFGGGVVNALFFQRGRPTDVIASMIGGAITANYLADFVSHITGTDKGVAGFVVGVTAMAICQGMLSIVPVWFNRLKGGKNSDA